MCMLTLINIMCLLTKLLYILSILHETRQIIPQLYTLITQREVKPSVEDLHFQLQFSLHEGHIYGVSLTLKRSWLYGGDFVYFCCQCSLHI